MAVGREVGARAEAVEVAAARVAAARAVAARAAAARVVGSAEEGSAVAETVAAATVGAERAAARGAAGSEAAARAEAARAAVATVAAQVEGCYAPRWIRLGRRAPARPTATAAHVVFALLPRAQDRGLHPSCFAPQGRVDRLPLALALGWSEQCH